jgi:hypothetical protein
LDPVERITARMVSPSLIASDTRLRTTTQWPSPLLYPFARSSKLYERLSGDRKFMFDSDRNESGPRIELVPPTKAFYLLVSTVNALKKYLGAGTMFDSPDRSPCTDMSSAIMLLEQAESKLTLGPVKLKNQLIRFASIACESPVAAYVGRFSGSFATSVL